MTDLTANPFGDLIPTATSTPTARPVLRDYKGDPAGFQAAMATYRGSRVPASTSTGSGQTTGTSAGHTNTLSPEQQALNQFANSAGMQFQLQQGENAIQNAAAAHGYLDSGAAAKALQSYGQQTALNNYFMPYMQLLGGQQAVGAQAGSSIAGVGSSFGNTVANINSNLGSNSAAINGQMAGYIGNGADAAANAALARGYANGQLYSQIGGALGQFGSSFMPTPHY